MPGLKTMMRGTLSAKGPRLEGRKKTRTTERMLVSRAQSIKKQNCSFLIDAYTDLEGEAAFQRYIECLQWLLCTQARWLVHEKGMPADLEVGLLNHIHAYDVC